MAIHIVCKNCNSKIAASEKLIGQTRKCPKCGAPILIEAEPAVVSTLIEKPEVSPEQEYDESRPLKIRKLAPNNIYVVLGSDREIAYWKGVEGWFVNVGSGFESILRAPDKLPDFGSFVFVEGYVAQTDVGKRLKALRFWKLSGRGALDVLKRNEADVLQKAQEPTTLTGTQKQLMLKHIRAHYFFEFTEGSEYIVEYLTGYDSHSRGVGEFVDQ